VGIADDGHHRDRRHPNLVRFLLAGVRRFDKTAQPVCRGPEIFGTVPRRGTEFAAAGRIPEQFESTAERGKRREICVAGTTGLSGLARETGQSFCRWREANGQETR
jgi:hypothetical protein